MRFSSMKIRTRSPCYATTVGRRIAMFAGRISIQRDFVGRRCHCGTRLLVGGVQHVAIVAVRRKASGEWAAYSGL